MCNADYMYPTTRLLADVGVDSVNTSMMKTTCKLVYRGLYKQGPKPLNDMFTLYCPSRELRSSTALMCDITRCKTQFGMKNVRVRGSMYWNMLPYDIKASISIDNFKQNIKKYTGFD